MEKHGDVPVNVMAAAMGIWMPHARVICFDCHGNTFPLGINGTRVLTEAEMALENKPTPVRPNYAVTACETCGKGIQVFKSVANEHNIVLSLRAAGISAQMVQTGGMNSACGVHTASGGYYFVTFDFDSDGI